MDQTNKTFLDQQNIGGFPYYNTYMGNFDDFQQNEQENQIMDNNLDNKDSSFCQGTEFPQIANTQFEFAKSEMPENDYFNNQKHKNSYQSYDTFSETAYTQNEFQNSPPMNQKKGYNGENLNDQQQSFLTNLKIDDISYDNNQPQELVHQNQYPNLQGYNNQSSLQSFSSDYEYCGNQVQNQQYPQYPQSQLNDNVQYDNDNNNNQLFNNNMNINNQQFNQQQQQQQQFPLINDYDKNFYIDNNRQYYQQQQGRHLYKSNSLQVNQSTKISIKRMNKTCIFDPIDSTSSSNSFFDQYNTNFDLNNNINNNINSENNIKKEENYYNCSNLDTNNFASRQEYEILKSTLKYPKNLNDARNYLERLSNKYFHQNGIDHSLFKEKNLQILQRKKTNEKGQETQRFRNMKKLIMNGILKYFQPEILSKFSLIPQVIQDRIVEIANQIRQAGKSNSEKNKYMDLFSQPHFNLVFLSLNKESCHCMSKNSMNIKLHKQIFKFDISKYDNSQETQEKVEYINVLKNFMYLVAKQFLEQDGEHEQSVVTEYKQIVLNSLDKMIVGHYINKFSSYKQLQQKNSESDIYVE